VNRPVDEDVQGGGSDDERRGGRLRRVRDRDDITQAALDRINPVSLTYQQRVYVVAELL
jgi:hypothetical protein